jgi:hypothetical protein
LKKIFLLKFYAHFIFCCGKGSGRIGWKKMNGSKNEEGRLKPKNINSLKPFPELHFSGWHFSFSKQPFHRRKVW